MPYTFIDEDNIPTQKQNNQIQEESLPYYLGRTVARTGARAGEAILGLPGDIANVGHKVASAILPEYAKEGIIPTLANKIAPYLPTSENIRKHGTEKLTGDYLKPQDQSEEFVDEIVQDAATLFTPNKGKLLKSVGSALGKSLAGNFAQWGAQEITDSPLLGGVAKIGAIALASTAGGRKELSKIKSDLYTDAYSHIGDKAKFNFTPEKTKIDSLYKKFSRGDSPHKDFILQRLDAINNVWGNKAITNPKDVINIKQGWNEYLRTPLDKKSKDTLMQAVNIANEGIARYGARNGKFFSPYKQGEELTRALNGSSLIQNLISKSPALQKSVSNPLVKGLLFGGSGYGLKKLTSLPIVGGVAGAAYTGREASKAFQLLTKSPLAQKYYFDVIKNTLKDNKKALAASLRNLDKVADKFMSEEGFQEQTNRQPTYTFID